MRRAIAARICAVLAFLCVCFAPPSHGQATKDWTWRDLEGRTRTRSELDAILRMHVAWLRSHEESGARADLDQANLAGGDLYGEELSRAYVNHVRLNDASLAFANLGAASLIGTDLSGADLRGANLNGTDLDGADLSKADLTGAVANGSTLTGANLSNARLDDVDLSNADLDGVDLRGASLAGANLTRTIFEPEFGPQIRGIAAARYLELVTYNRNPDALVQLRKELKDGGFREEERKITYAIRRTEAEILWLNCAFWQKRQPPLQGLWP